MSDAPISPDELLACAVDAVTAAARHAEVNRSRRGEVMETARHDIKLVMDRECQDVIFDVIRSRYARHAILGEEGSSVVECSPYEWIVDPIDGTMNFYRGLPWWCHTVSVRSASGTLAGTVYAPELDLLYTATVDSASQCNGESIRTSSIAELSEGFLMTGVSKAPEDLMNGIDVLTKIAPQMKKTRIMGAAALDMCQVAHGRIDVFYESGIYLWDVAAGMLIVNQAGGRSRIVQEKDDGRLAVLAANAHLYDAAECGMDRVGR